MALCHVCINIMTPMKANKNTLIIYIIHLNEEKCREEKVKKRCQFYSLLSGNKSMENDTIDDSAK